MVWLLTRSGGAVSLSREIQRIARTGAGSGLLAAVRAGCHRGWAHLTEPIIAPPGARQPLLSGRDRRAADARAGRPEDLSRGVVARRVDGYPLDMRRIAPILLLLFPPAPAISADFTAKVVGVSDGDTITLLRDGRTQVKIRLHGIDAPESGQEFGIRAKQAASELAFGKVATVKERDTDRYGRTVADVILPDGRSLNHEPVGHGMAWWFREYAPSDRELAVLEAGAKAARRGLWSVPGAVPPWDWRKDVGVPVTTRVIGNRNSRVYHRPNRASVGRMTDKNRVTFGSIAKAEKAGYRKAGDCR
jgi:micrococcal nuclease